MAMIVEYLLIVQKADTFCATAEAFTQLLNIDSSIEIEGGKTRYGDDFECDYGITSGEIEAKQQRFFHVRFSAQNCEKQEQIHKFSDLLTVVRSVMSKLGGQPETLWDDISFYYSKDAYELIYRVENLMRKLIANFMLVTVGVRWIDESAPKEVKEVIDRSKRKEYLNVLHSVDFIDLAKFLLRPYSNTSAEDVYERIRKAETVADLTALKALTPQSNWSRYFSALVECEDEYLKKRWEQLYDLRCKVAHNAIVGKADSERVRTLVSELEEKLEDAIRKLPQVNVPGTEVEQIAENAAKSISQLTGEFISAWRVFEGRVVERAQDYEKKATYFRRAIDILRRNGVFHIDHCERAMLLCDTKKHLVHSTGVSLSPDVLRHALKDIRVLTGILLGDEEEESSVESSGDLSSSGYSYGELDEESSTGGMRYIGSSSSSSNSAESSER